MVPVQGLKWYHILEDRTNFSLKLIQRTGNYLFTRKIPERHPQNTYIYAKLLSKDDLPILVETMTLMTSE